MENGRRYIMNFGTLRSCGIGSMLSTCAKISLLNTFDVTYDTTPITTITYPSISIEDLKTLPKIEYEKRVIDFLNVVTGDEGIKELLFNAASFNEPCSNYFCDLNENFLVYKFLSGIRIVDVGKPNGIVEYKVYPIDENPMNYNWVRNQTHLNLNQNEVYIVKIRDNVDGEIICEYEKNISIPLLISSTTEPPVDRKVMLVNTSNSSCGNTDFRYGRLDITPPLIMNQCFMLNYSINLWNNSNIGRSGFIVKCKPNGSPTYSDVVNYEICNGNYLFDESINVKYGDDVRYIYCVTSPTYGNDGFSKIKLNTTEGNYNTPISIDISKCEDTLFNTCDPIPIVVSFNETFSSSPTAGVNFRCGDITLSDSIQNQDYITLSISGVTESNYGVSQYAIYRKLKDDVIFSCYTGNTNMCTQPKIFNNIKINSGDCYKYCSVVIAQEPGTVSKSSFIINDIGGTYGVNPSIGINNSIIHTCCTLAAPIVANLCVTCNTVCEQTAFSYGFINLVPPLNTLQQCVVVDLVGVLNKTNNGVSYINVFCRPNESSNYIEIPTLKQNSNQYIGTYSENITIKQGDSICYTLAAVEPNNIAGTSASASLKMNTISGFGGINASINTSKCIDSVVNSEPNLISTVNICRTNCECSGHACYTYGYINVSPVLNSSFQCVDVNYSGVLYKSGDGVGYVCLSCKPNGTSTFIPITSSIIDTSTLIGSFTNSFNMKQGDCISYCLLSVRPNSSSTASSSIKIDSLTGFGGVDVTIDLTKCSDSVSN